MPLFEYICRECGHKAEVLLRNGQKPACPDCGSKRMEKQMSHFAPMSGAADPPPACESCCSAAGSCPMRGSCE